MTNMEIAKTIQSQLGRQALFMIGTKQLVAVERGLFIKHSCRGSKTNGIKITLNGFDLYDIVFTKTWGDTIKTVAEVENVYCDQLHDMIETHTGLYTHF